MVGAEPPRFLERVRIALRSRHYSLRTEQSYVGWIKRYILFHQKRHPSTMGASEVNAFLSHLPVRRSGECVDAEPGAKRAVVPLLRSLGAAAATARGSGACPEAAAAPGGSDAAGGRSRSGADEWSAASGYMH